jgi:hypothetical protein
MSSYDAFMQEELSFIDFEKSQDRIVQALAHIADFKRGYQSCEL